MKIFKNRSAAGQLLAERLKNTIADLVLGIPRGGVVVAAEIAKYLGLPLDIIVTRKIGAPNQPELALGAVDPDGKVVWDHELLWQLKLKVENLKPVCRQAGLKIDDEMEEVKRRERLYRKGKELLNIQKKVVILADDGVATGATTLAAINYLKRHKAKKVILAVPVASQDTIDRIRESLGKFGEAIVLETPEHFRAVGEFYQEFEPVSDDKVVYLLKIKNE